MKNNWWKYIWLLLLFTACDEKDQPGEGVVDTSTVRQEAIAVPTFQEDSAYKYVEMQVSEGPRVPNTEPHVRTKNILVEKLRGFGVATQVQEFTATAYDGTELELFNIIGSVNPDAGKRILLAAHWDTRPIADQDTVRQDEPIMGANDGASGVGVLLEIARILAQDTLFDLGVDFIFFDGEDYGAPHDWEGDKSAEFWCLGSQYWSNNKHKPNYQAFYGILLDMVGAEDARFARDRISLTYAPSVVDKVWNTAKALGYSSYFTYYSDVDIIDDHLFVNRDAGIPMIDIIHYDEDGFGDFWHTHADDMSAISKTTLKAVGRTVLYVLYKEI